MIIKFIIIYQIKIISLRFKGKMDKKETWAQKKDRIIGEIKQLDDQIKHVCLNLYKCSANSTQNDVIKTFKEFKFQKVKKVEPGFFQLEFQARIDAISFIRQSQNKQILNEKFEISLGHQKKSNEEWSSVSYAKKNPNAPNNESLVKVQQAQKSQKKKKKKKQKGEQSKVQSQIKSEVKNNEAKVETDTKQQKGKEENKPSVWSGEIQNKDVEKTKNKNKVEKTNETAWSNELKINKQPINQKNQNSNTSEVWKKQIQTEKKPALQNLKTKDVQIKKQAQISNNQQESPIQKKKKKKKKVEESTLPEGQKQNEKKEEIPLTKTDQDDGWIVVKPKTKKK